MTKIHILCEVPRSRTGFSVVGKHLAEGLKKLGYEITMTGFQTAYESEWYKGIEILPLQSQHVDELTQYISNIRKSNPDLAICIFNGDNADQNMFAKAISPTCLIPESPILTLSRGVQKIKDVKIGDKVMTHKGRFMKVTDVMKRYYKGDMIKLIPLKFNTSITLTPEHKVLAMKTLPCTGDTGITSCRPDGKCYRNIDGNTHKRCKYLYEKEPWRNYKVEWIDAKDLSVGDWVVYPNIREKEVDIEKINIMNYIKDSSLNIVGDFAPGFQATLDFNSENYLGTCAVKKMSTISNFANDIPQEVELSEDFMRLCGYFIAEGGIHRNSNDSPGGITFAFNINETDYINDVKNIMKKSFSLECSFYDEYENEGIKGCWLTYESMILGELFSVLFAPEEYETKKGRGRKSNIVRLPPEFLNLPLNKIKELIKGYWRGDGSVNVGSKRKGQEYSFSTTSITFSHQIIYLMARFGILCSMKIRQPQKENHSLSYYLMINGSDMKLFEDIINEQFIDRNFYRQINKYIKGTNFNFIPVRSIDIIRYDNDVYNLEIEEDNSYISNIVVHNCFYVPIEGRSICTTMENDLKIISEKGKIIAQCNWGHNEMKKKGIDSEVIYHGYDPTIFRKLSRIDISVMNEKINIVKHIDGRWTEVNSNIGNLKKEFNGKFIFGFCGANHGIRKRIERLLRAYSLFLDNNKQLKDRTLLVLKTMPISITSPAILPQKCDELGISSNVVFLYGDNNILSDDAMNSVYNTFDVNVSASSSEGFGFPTLETIAIGIPQIGPNCSSFVELIGNGETKRGLLADKGEWVMIVDGSERFEVNEQCFADKMTEIYKDDNLREKLRKNCIEWSKQYTWDKVIAQWDKLIKSMRNKT